MDEVVRSTVLEFVPLQSCLEALELVLNISASVLVSLLGVVAWGESRFWCSSEIQSEVRSMLLLYLSRSLSET